MGHTQKLLLNTPSWSSLTIYLLNHQALTLRLPSEYESWWIMNHDAFTDEVKPWSEFTKLKEKYKSLYHMSQTSIIRKNKMLHRLGIVHMSPHINNMLSKSYQTFNTFTSALNDIHQPCFELTLSNVLNSHSLHCCRWVVVN